VHAPLVRFVLTDLSQTKENGTVFGRSKELTPKQVVELQKRRREGALIKTLMTDYSLSKASVYRYLKVVDLPPGNVN
jgi:hypothetical protein